MKTTLLITTYNRDRLLQIGLETIRREEHPNLDIIVLNDGDVGNTENIALHYGARYMYTAINKTGWRIPGFAFNIGAKNCDPKTDILVLSCSEMYHVNNCLEILCRTVHKDPMALAIPEGKDDHESRFLSNLGDMQKYAECRLLRTELPFLMALQYRHYMSIGGYDEDFTGASYDDDDLVDRLQAYGCHYIKTEAKCVHLYHDRDTAAKHANGALERNKKLYLERKNQIVRNQNRKWGQF